MMRRCPGKSFSFMPNETAGNPIKPSDCDNSGNEASRKRNRTADFLISVKIANTVQFAVRNGQYAMVNTQWSVRNAQSVE